MSESYTISDTNDYTKLFRNVRIETIDTTAELLEQIVGELVILNGTLGKIERALTGGVADG